VTLNLRSQNASANYGGRRYLPYVFTEHGILMLSSVLNSQHAIDMNIMIMRAFVLMRQYMLRQASKHDEVRELKRLLLLHIENTDGRFAAHDERINEIMRVLNNLIEHPKPRKTIGFSAN